jgi:hypothetical protein
MLVVLTKELSSYRALVLQTSTRYAPMKMMLEQEQLCGHQIGRLAQECHISAPKSNDDNTTSKMLGNTTEITTFP